MIISSFVENGKISSRGSLLKGVVAAVEIIFPGNPKRLFFKNFLIFNNYLLVIITFLFYTEDCGDGGERSI
ncbi:hypothetical protein BDF14DRAFT_1863848, partial [Spinellus fusiger]